MVWRWIGGCMALFSLSMACHSDPVLRLETSLAPPYQELHGSQLSGESVGTVKCVLDKLHHPYQLNLVPAKRAQSNLQNGVSDGFFSAIPQEQLDQVATLSAPIVLEKWFWFSLMPGLPAVADFPPYLKIGVLRGSNQEQWLQDKGINITQSVNQLSSLLRLLQIGRIDTFLVDENVMQQLLVNRTGHDLVFQHRFERYVPMGIYFARRFAANHPDFIRQFNHQIPACAITTMHVTAEEEQKIRSMVDKAVIPLLQSRWWFSLLSSSNQRNRTLDMNEIEQRDAIWKAASEEKIPVPDWITGILSSSESRFLKQWQASQQGLFEEVLLTDSRGLLVASSEMTTDYWQGDEEKVLRPLHMISAAPERLAGWFDLGDANKVTPLIEYDDSTHQFLVHISYPIRDKQEVTGILCLGINLDIALKEWR